AQPRPYQPRPDGGRDPAAAVPSAFAVPGGYRGIRMQATAVFPDADHYNSAQPARDVYAWACGCLAYNARTGHPSVTGGFQTAPEERPAECTLHQTVLRRSTGETIMSKSLSDAHAALYTSLNLMLAGDPEPVLAVWSLENDVSFAGPFGGFSFGRQAVADDFRRQAAMHLGGRLEVTDVRLVETPDMGFSFCTEHGSGHVIDGAPASLTHRATNIFRREAQGWRLVHHHTDLSSP
ncbi:MAG: YybH family protein, partial [Steroidobacteraceae bacterium]